MIVLFDTLTLTKNTKNFNDSRRMKLVVSSRQSLFPDALYPSSAHAETKLGVVKESNSYVLTCLHGWRAESHLRNRLKDFHGNRICVSCWKHDIRARSHSHSDPYFFTFAAESLQNSLHLWYITGASSEMSCTYCVDLDMVSAFATYIKYGLLAQLSISSNLAER